MFLGFTFLGLMLANVGLEVYKVYKNDPSGDMEKQIAANLGMGKEQLAFNMSQAEEERKLLRENQQMIQENYKTQRAFEGEQADKTRNAQFAMNERNAQASEQMSTDNLFGTVAQLGKNTTPYDPSIPVTALF